MSFEKLNLTVVHVLNYLILSKLQNFVYILISVYIQNYLWCTQIHFYTKKIICIIPISANITWVPNIQKKNCWKCVSTQGNQCSLLSHCFQNTWNQSCAGYYIRESRFFLSSEGFRNTMKLILYETAVNWVMKNIANFFEICFCIL